jgi:uncharacterized protein (TIGR04255 family)
MGQKWAHAPVYCALAQVRHNPVWQLADYVPRLQDTLRQIGYPDARTEATTLVQLPPPPSEPGAAPAPPRIEQVARLVCADRERTHVCFVNPDRFTYCTTEYETFERFRDDFLAGLAPVVAALKLEYVEQVSMRYLDAVVPPNGEASLSEYLVPEVLGLTPRITDRVTIRRAECVIQFQTEDRLEVIARTWIQAGPITLPPDLQPIAVKIPDRFSAVNAVHAVLDTDAHYEERQSFDGEALRTLMQKLRNAVEIAFNATVTPAALSAWRE